MDMKCFLRIKVCLFVGVENTSYIPRMRWNLVLASWLGNLGYAFLFENGSGILCDGFYRYAYCRWLIISLFMFDKGKNVKTNSYLWHKWLGTFLMENEQTSKRYHSSFI